MKTRIDVLTLNLPGELVRWAGDAVLYESSGESGARTVYVDAHGGAYLKIAPAGSLERACNMQKYFAAKNMSSPVIKYISADRDYLITAPLAGKDATHEEYTAQPERLSAAFGEALRALHAVDARDCPAENRTLELANAAENAGFRQQHLDDIDMYIGPANASMAAAEIAKGKALLREDTLLHGDYCLPNMILDNWKFSGFIDVAEGGLGDRHYDIAWGLWTLSWNLKSQKYGKIFLDAYGRDAVDGGRLRVCGLLAGLE